MTAPTVAVVGASPDRRKFGNKAVRAHLARGYRVVPVNPSAAAVEGQPAVASVADVPAGRIDRVTVYVPPPVALRVLGELAGKDVGEVWLNPGTDTPEVVAKARELGLNVVQACSIVDLGLSPADFTDE